jgi:hypothetical protein
VMTRSLAEHRPGEDRFTPLPVGDSGLLTEDVHLRPA